MPALSRTSRKPKKLRPYHVGNSSPKGASCRERIKPAPAQKWRQKRAASPRRAHCSRLRKNVRGLPGTLNIVFPLGGTIATPRRFTVLAGPWSAYGSTMWSSVSNAPGLASSATWPSIHGLAQVLRQWSQDALSDDWRDAVADLTEAVPLRRVKHEPIGEALQACGLPGRDDSRHLEMDGSDGLI